MNRFDWLGWFALAVGVGVLVALAVLAVTMPWWVTLIYAGVGVIVMLCCVKVLCEAPRC